MTLKINGLHLSFMSEILHKVPVHLDKYPYLHPTPDDRFTPQQWQKLCDELEYQSIFRLPLSLIGRTSFETLCRVYSGSRVMLNEHIEDLFQRSPPHRLLSKIKNSIWRSSLIHAGWNEIVEAWQGLHRFEMGNLGLEVEVDHTTGFNTHGYAEYSYNTYLDGSMAFLIKYRGAHVLTIGFTFASCKRLLIQQIQFTQRTGNRWLFKLPIHYASFVISKLRSAFPNHRLYIVSGVDLAERSIQNYKSTIARIEAKRSQSGKPISTYDYERILKAQSSLDHILRDKERIISVYKSIPNYSNKQLSCHGMRHFLLTPSADT
ncbi:hypothetical protein [Acetobacter pomorum]|uniref:hypothetical protein n=1 Tax=Acetobacter pomorum TaxID=65959 RepID=UPI001178A263|nr:hypothetical protein [Acetobacter pomorum]